MKKSTFKIIPLMKKCVRSRMKTNMCMSVCVCVCVCACVRACVFDIIFDNCLIVYRNMIRNNHFV